MSYNLIPCIEEIKLNIEKNTSCDKNIIHGCILGEGSFGTVCYVDPKQCNPPIEKLEPFALKYMNFSKHISRDDDKKKINLTLSYLKTLLDQEVRFLNELKEVTNVLNIIAIVKKSGSFKRKETYIHMFNREEYCIATEYLNGKDLSYYIVEKYNRKPPANFNDDSEFKNELDYIAQQLILTLKQIHDKKILHLDIKTENIILDDSTIPPRPVIIDFGLAKTGINHGNKQTTGTPEFIPYEVKNTTRFNDIYALGRTLGELYKFMAYDEENNTWTEQIIEFNIIKGLDYSTFIASFINEEKPEQTIQKYDELVKKIKDDPIKSSPNPTQVVDPTGIVSTVRDQEIDPLIERFNVLQLEAYVRLKETPDYDFTELIKLIRSVKVEIKKRVDLKSGWFRRKKKLEDYPNINKLLYTSEGKIKEGRPTPVDKPTYDRDNYENMIKLISDGNAPSDNETIDTQKGGRRKSLRKQYRKSRRKRSRRNGKRSIKKIKIKQSRNRKRSRKRY